MKDNRLSKTRIWELDFFRGIALILMIYFHTIYDLKEFYNYPVVYASGINFYIGKLSATLFILISGISTSLSKNNVKRGLKVFGIAMIITIITTLYDVRIGIKFGILHFLGISMLLSPFITKINKYTLIVLGTFIIIVGRIALKATTTVGYLFPFGLTTNTFTSGDYYPLLPWLGVFMYGIALGKLVYSKKRSIFKFSLNTNIVSLAGQKTLPVYLMHQPTIIVFLLLLKYLFAD